MDRPARRRRPEPAAIDITWVSCRGVRSSVPFHTPCLYASVYLTTSSPPPTAASSGAHGHGHGRRPHRVKTPTDRAGGGNPEWDAPLRLYVPDAAGGGGNALLVRFELKSVVAVLGDVLAASAVVPVADLVADGRTRRVSYQLAASDGRQHNGVISFSYAFHDRSNGDANESEGSGSDEKIVETPRCLAAACAVALPPPPPQQQTTTMPGMYPVIDRTLTEQVAMYSPPATSGMAVVTASRYYYPPPPMLATPVERQPAAVSPPACGLYPTVDLAPVSCYPSVEPCYGGGCGYAAAPEWDGRCLYG